MRVAALYVDPRGPYPRMTGVDAWDAARDARGYAGPGPVVAHPPCGPWGHLRALCRLQDPDAAPAAVAQVRRWGGVLEHPVGSRLWGTLGLPRPGEPPDAWGGATIRVEQVAWGHACRKPTLLYMVGLDPDEARASARTGGTPTHAIASRARRGGLLAPSAAARRRTPPAFAEWLVGLAAGALPNAGPPADPVLSLECFRGWARLRLRAYGRAVEVACAGPRAEANLRAIAAGARVAMFTGAAAVRAATAGWLVG